MKDIIVVAPFLENSPPVQWGQEVYRNVAGVDFVGIDKGKDPVVTFSDVELNIPGILNRIVLSQREGYRAAIIGCFGDPGLIAARQLVPMPVIGPGETALAIASTLGDRILLIEPQKDLVYVTERMVYAYGLRDKVVGVRSLDEKGAQAAITRCAADVRHAAETCLQGVKETGAQVIILGCIGFCLMVDEIGRFLKENGVSCPIIEPGITSMEYARMLLGLGLNQSREMFKI